LISINSEYLTVKGGCHDSQTDHCDTPLTRLMFGVWTGVEMLTTKVNEMHKIKVIFQQNS